MKASNVNEANEINQYKHTFMKLPVMQIEPFFSNYDGAIESKDIQ